jgi:N-acetylmuramoyl-L-alanine amidase
MPEMNVLFSKDIHFRYQKGFIILHKPFFFAAQIVVSVLLGVLFAMQSLPAQVPTSAFAFPKAHYAVHLDDKPTSLLTVIELAGRLYTEPVALATALDCELRSEGVLSVLLTPSHVLAFAVDAHVVAVQAANSDTVSLTQMLHPVALQGGRLYLPLDDVLRLLADTGVYEVDERDADVYLRSNTFIPPPQVPSKEVSKNDPSAEQKAPATKPFRKPTRNLYILPDDVKRRDMDSLPQKTSHVSPFPCTNDCDIRQNFINSLNPSFGGTDILVCESSKPEYYAQDAQNNAPNLTDKNVCATKKRFSSCVMDKDAAVSLHSAKRWASTLLLSRLLTRAANTTQAAKKKTATLSKSKSPEKSAQPHQNAHSDNDFASAKKKWALDVIVLDAGHGGKDGGTIGFGKTKEKDVALGIVKKLGAMLKKELHGTKIVYTRTDDTFVELDRRGQIANENGGKLFISVHCNSTPKKPSKANGFEVYILRPGRNDDAVRVAEMENAVIKLEDNPKRYKPLTDEQFIVVSMAQSAFVKYSDMAAAMISAEVKKLHEIGIRGVNQAGFLVLVGASMPNMLIETGFLSNKKDEKLLKSERGQMQMASAICRAIKAYRNRYEAQIKGQAKADNIPSPVPEKKKSASSTAVAPKSPTLPQRMPKPSSSAITKSSKVHHK